MMVCDAKWLGNILSCYSDQEISPVLNIGSSSEKFRKEDKPHIHRYVFAPLESRGVKVVHCDLKEADGIDITADLFDNETIKKLAAVKPESIICTHMFEHVVDREELARRLIDLLPENGLLFITVPYSYHYHADPIDTMYRPSPDELALLFKEHEILDKEILDGGTYWDLIKKRPFVLFFRHFIRFFIPFINFYRWKRSMKKLYWLFHHYKVSAIVVRKKRM